MASSAGGGDAWRITGEDRIKHDSQFFTLKPINGFISGDQARGFFMQSGLPTPVLGQIWGLADMNNDGKMDKKEFSIAMHLIKKKLQGYELPKALPASLKADPSPVIGSIGSFGSTPQPAMVSMGMVPVAMAGPGVAPRMPVMTNGMPPMVVPAGYMATSSLTSMESPVAGQAPVPGGFSATLPNKQSAPPPSGNLAMPHPSKLKYTQLFNSHDRNKQGALTGVEARAILMQTGAPQQTLAQIWGLSDVDKDGKLNCDEFCIAMHLIDLVKMGTLLPPKLPPELVPSKPRSGSFGVPAPAMPPAAPVKDGFGDLLGSVGMPAPVQPTTNGEAKVEEVDMGPVTFEDRRKQNFDKGQAELERRRLMLQEQMQQENRARLDKERKEQELRERQRQEQEMKRQQELERQMERQRQVERQREEQRNKMLEQRESARRELERQRQMEWERQRKEQLMAEKAREYGQLTALKSQASNLNCELESLQGKKTEISTKISQVKNGVTDFTAHIEAMRSTRDLKLADIERLQKALQESNQMLHTLQSARETLDLRVQTSVQANPMSETHRTMMHSVELKKTSVQKLKKELEETEKETEIRLTEIDQNNSQMTEMSTRIAKLQQDLGASERQRQNGQEKQTEEQDRVRREKEKHDQLRKELEAQRLKEETEKKSNEKSQKKPESSGVNWFDFGGDTKTSTANDNWASVFDSQQASAPKSTGMWASSSSQPTTASTDTGEVQKKFKLSGPQQAYKVLYQFDARNVDELSLLPGDTVMVYKDQTGAEPGWLGAEMGGKSGWFPEAYAEQDSSQLLTAKDTSTGGAISSSEDSSFITVPGKMPSVSPTPGQGKTAPEGLQAQALYPWKAKKENHLTFNKGDIIGVREQQDMWWSGELEGKVGWFPKSYVKLISGPTSTTPTPAAPTPAAPAPTFNSTDTSSTLPPAIPHASTTTDKPPAAKEGEPHVAVFPYISNEPGDLTFNQHEIVIVTSMDGDWWTGTIGDKTGIFPATYVQKSDAPDAQQQGSLKSLKKPEIATVIAAYTATGQEQLSLNPGQLIQVRKKSTSGWWEGELQARGQKRKIGWFPANYVKLLVGSARNTPDFTLNRGVSPSTLSNASNPSPAPQPHPTTAPAQPSLQPVSATPQSTPQSTAQKYVDHVIAIYPYMAQNADELTFQKDSVINVIKKADPDWWQGEINGSLGMFPSNYVSSTSPEATSWSTDPQVLAVTSQEEWKRQSHIQEMITTEEKYMADMSIVLDAFYKPLEMSGCMTADELLAIFVNWKDLIVCNTKFHKALRVRKKMCGVGQVVQCIGDILCESIPHMTAYIRFCSCQLNAAALLQRLTENNPQFIEIHKKCVQNPKTKGMPLSSFLLKPMQRITKYPLLVEKILNHTPAGHPDHPHLIEALECTQELCSQVNEGVREKENSDRLEWIQQHAHCDGLPERIVFNSVTNCLGPRKLLHTGVLCKAKSNKELAAFLFNDFLLLTTSNKPLSNANYSVFDPTGQVQYKMYKTPVFLNEIMVKTPLEEHSDVFTLSHIDRVYNLRCASINDRDTWSKKLMTSSRYYLDTERKKREKASSLRRSPGVGRLLVVLIEGVDLQASDVNGKSDPYCEVSMGSQEHKTKVINQSLNPKWNASMQFTIRDVNTDVLCITVFDRDLFSPNDFLGRTEIRVKDIMIEAGNLGRRPIVKTLLLHEVPTGEVVVKLDLHLFDQT